MNYVTGSVIKELRTQKGLTQKELADVLKVSDKTISKWETDKGLPDVVLLEDLAKALHVSIAELLTGEVATNQNRCANMKKVGFYVCPICGNVILSTGEGHFSCCGITLPKQEVEDALNHTIQHTEIDGEIYLSVDHEMSKKHYISFIAYVTSSKVQLVKLYPEQSAECRMTKCGHGQLYAFCNHHGLFMQKI